MTWVTILTSMFLLLLLTGLVSWLVLYIQFGKSIEKQWATEVFYLLQDAENCVRSENRQLQELKTERDTKSRLLHEEKYAAHLGDYSVDELEAYPGIGPGTIGKLRGAGFINLAVLHRAHIHIHGLGEKRLADIEAAIRDLVRRARSTFDAGSCRHAHTLADQLKTLSARYDRLEAEAHKRAGATEEFIDRLGETVAYARTVCFWRWFRPISNEALIPAEIMDAPLPSLEAALRAAENQGTRNRTAKRPQAPVIAQPVVPMSPSRQAMLSVPATSSRPTLATSLALSRPAAPPPQPASPTRHECLSLLEIPLDTHLSADVVRRQWNLLSERLAPEKVASMGEDFVKLAQTKLAGLRQAAELLLEAMGEKLESKPPTPPIQDPRHNPDLDDVLGGM